MLRFPLTFIIAWLALVSLGPYATADIYGYAGEDGTIYLSDTPADEHYELLATSPVEPVKNTPNTAPALPVETRTAFADVDNKTIQGMPYQAIVKVAAETNRLDGALLHAVITAESNYNPRAVSPKGAVGLMQLMPNTARRYGVTNSYDPAQNIQGGARYLSYLLNLFDNDFRLAVAAYNAGENSVLRHGRNIPPFRETSDYVRKVMGLYKRYSSYY